MSFSLRVPRPSRPYTGSFRGSANLTSAQLIFKGKPKIIKRKPKTNRKPKKAQCAADYGHGSGRPKGSRTVRLKKIAEKAALTGRTPLEVMLEAMRCHQEAGNLDRAAAIARTQRPIYIHDCTPWLGRMGYQS